MKKIAVVLSGCGHLDGSEVRESVGVLWGLNVAGCEAHCFAPDRPQVDVMNHLTREPETAQTRNLLQESARIARGKILPLTKMAAGNFNGIVLPGGFGAAKNLADFASKGSQGKVLPELEKILNDFFEQKKPIGAVCIAPAIVGLALKSKKLQLTLGAPGEAAQEIEKLGHTHKVTAAHEICRDATNRVVTTPAYMYDSASLADIFKGIQTLCKTVEEWA